MSVIGVIPARGGSKGIEKKNIVDFLGVPLIAHTIRQAKESDYLTEVFVSTDDEAIATVSRKYDAKVIDRPDELAGDEASTESALLHAVRQLREQGNEPDILVLLQCTSPLRRSGDIDDVVSLVRDGEYDSALSCCEDHKFYWKRENDRAIPINYDPQTRKRRQDLDKRYQENGSIYVTEVESLVRTECRLGNTVGIYEMPRILSFEIDTPEDLKIVRSIAKATEFDLLLADP